ncbi:MAG: hypothetical protein R3C19_04585 [Planctomycetaceae bacterium]
MAEMHDPVPDYSRLPEEPADHLGRLGLGMLVLLFILLVLTLVFALGQRAEQFRWDTFRSGMLAFGAISLSAVLLVSLLAGALKLSVLLWPKTATNQREKIRLFMARRKAVAAIDRKQQLCEERARLTARLQATYLFEKESSKLANVQASREFREALQKSVTRSCEIAFEHITRVVSQYQQVVAEIESSPLCDAEKTQLLDALAEQLDISAVEDRSRGAQQMMEAEIWKVRFRKARLLAKENPERAVTYLRRIQPEARGPRLNEKIESLIEKTSEQ